eukprot:FR735892.1.p2 GENE.FR735892.1~~FR735892.1.p2  ORF type:complete len:109 (-),score=43.18 FR735892.1:707-1033(-)
MTARHIKCGVFFSLYKGPPRVLHFCCFGGFCVGVEILGGYQIFPRGDLLGGGDAARGDIFPPLKEKKKVGVPPGGRPFPKIKGSQGFWAPGGPLTGGPKGFIGVVDPW